jgi:hypothetical protein
MSSGVRSALVSGVSDSASLDVIDERLCAVLGRARRLQCPEVDPDRAALVGSEELNIVLQEERGSTIDSS